VKRFGAPFFLLVGILFALITQTRSAAAQVHWDGAVEAGAMKRIVTNAPNGDDVGIGPIFGVRAHIALAPLVRVGAYFDTDISPQADIKARRVYEGGLRFKVTAPWSFDEAGAIRVYAFLGFGYAGVYAPSSHTTLPLAGGTGQLQSQDVFLPGAGGGIYEIPFGLGGEWRFARPFALSAELGFRAGIANTGSLYSTDGRSAVTTGAGSITGVSASDPTGNDSWAVGLTVGIGFDL
jgi:hypothetical protein